jgi:hypothetical protein
VHSVNCQRVLTRPYDPDIKMSGGSISTNHAFAQVLIERLWEPASTISGISRGVHSVN